MPKTLVPITGSVLAWAIDESGITRDQIAAKLEISTDDLRLWELEDARPTLTKFRHLARLLKRTPSTFLLPTAPPVTEYAVAFRRPSGKARKELNPAERRYLREASRLQETTAWLTSELRDEIPDIPELTFKADPETSGEAIRSRLSKVGQVDASKWGTVAEAFDGWRDMLQGWGMQVLLLPMGKESAQGFSLWDTRTPLIAVNTAWNDQARIYTLFHEVGHLLTRSSSICLDRAGSHFARSDDNEERWCDQFAAALLLPRAEVARYLQSRFGWSPGDKITRLAVSSALAASFRVSWRAATIRLIEMNAATWDLYNTIPEASEEKRGGGGGGGRVRREIREDQYGRRTVEVFVRALEKDVIGPVDALDYLDVTAAGLSELRVGLRPAPSSKT